MLHVKGSDPTKNPSTIPSTDFARITDAGGPTDVTDWKRIFEAAADVDYYHWEYDMAADPFASSKIASTLLNTIQFGKVRDETGTVGGTVPATLSLTLGAPATFGAFVPGVQTDYSAQTTATVTSTAGDATLAVTDPGPPDQRRVQPRRAAARRVRQVHLDRPDHQRERPGHVQAAHQEHGPAAHGVLQQDRHLHAEHHSAVSERGRRGAELPALPASMFAYLTS